VTLGRRDWAIQRRGDTETRRYGDAGTGRRGASNELAEGEGGSRDQGSEGARNRGEAPEGRRGARDQRIKGPRGRGGWGAEVRAPAGGLSGTAPGSFSVELEHFVEFPVPDRRLHVRPCEGASTGCRRRARAVSHGDLERPGSQNAGCQSCKRGSWAGTGSWRCNRLVFGLRVLARTDTPGRWRHQARGPAGNRSPSRCAALVGTETGLVR